MAATNGFGIAASRFSSSCPPRESASPSAGVVTRRNSSMSAPAIHESVFPLISIAPTMVASCSMRAKICSNTGPTRVFSVFTGESGWS